MLHLGFTAHVRVQVKLKIYTGAQNRSECSRLHQNHGFAGVTACGCHFASRAWYKLMLLALQANKKGISNITSVFQGDNEEGLKTSSRIRHQVWKPTFLTNTSLFGLTLYLGLPALQSYVAGSFLGWEIPTCSSIPSLKQGTGTFLRYFFLSQKPPPKHTEHFCNTYLKTSNSQAPHWLKFLLYLKKKNKKYKEWFASR